MSLEHDWRSLYPFDAHLYALPGGARMHYVDEGAGPPLLCVHGNPTWSFYFRSIITGLSDEYRVIAPDHIGCGLSDKPQIYRYTLSQRIEDLTHLVESLDLREATLIAHDWGGAIGLGTVLKLRERFSKIILLNTGAFPPHFLPLRLRIGRTKFLGEFLLRRLNLFSRHALKAAVHRPEGLSPATRAGLLAPYDSYAHRVAVARFVQDIPTSPDQPTWKKLAEIEAGLPTLAELPWLLLWGMHDWVFNKSCLEKFQQLIPTAENARIPRCRPLRARGRTRAYRAARSRIPRSPSCSVHAPGRQRQGGDFVNDSANYTPNSQLTTGQCATLACLLEVSAPKPGNVHRGADFEDLTFYDMAAAAVAIGPAMDRALERPLGKTIYDAVVATQLAIDTNANLGTILLIAPLAAVQPSEWQTGGLAKRMAFLSAEDTRLVYEAIRLARPGGMGKVAEHDLAEEPPHDLLPAMQNAADHDLVARQYVNGFHEVLAVALPQLVEGVSQGWPLPVAIVRAQMQLLAAEPDSLIARKCGLDLARQVSTMAAKTLAAGQPGEETYERELAELDFFLRADGHRRNPGTTADLLAAALFAGLRLGRLQLPAHLRPASLAATPGSQS